ncbi:MAG: nuclear transport factor 2 family protein [Sphingorhabdus sp.]
MAFTPQQLSDMEEIRRLKHRYFRAIDTGDEALLATLFTEDVSIDYRGGAYRAQLQGKANMLDFIGSAFNSDIVAQHQGHSPEIDFTGDDDAVGLWYLEDRFIDPQRQQDTVGTALYRDRYRRTDDGWKIAHSEYDRVYEIIRPIPADEKLTYHLLARTGRKPEARVDVSGWLEWYSDKPAWQD